MQRCERCAREFAPGIRPECIDPLCPLVPLGDATINEGEIDRAALLRAAAAMGPDDGDTFLDQSGLESTRQYDDVNADPEIARLADRLRAKFAPRAEAPAAPKADDGGDSTLTSERPKDLAALFEEARSRYGNPEEDGATVEIATLRRDAPSAPELDVDPLAMTEQNRFGAEVEGLEDEATSGEEDEGYAEDEVDRTAPMTAAEIGLGFGAPRPELPVPPPKPALPAASPPRPGLPVPPVRPDSTMQIEDDEVMEVSNPNLVAAHSPQSVVRDFVPPLYQSADQSVEQLKAMSPSTVEQAMRQARGEQGFPGQQPGWAGGYPPPPQYPSGGYPPQYGAPQYPGQPPGHGYPQPPPGYPGQPPYPGHYPPEGSYVGPPPAGPPAANRVPLDKLVIIAIIVLAAIGAVLAVVAFVLT